jgi:hypothetical protein
MNLPLGHNKDYAFYILDLAVETRPERLLPAPSFHGSIVVAHGKGFMWFTEQCYAEMKEMSERLDDEWYKFMYKAFKPNL